MGGKLNNTHILLKTDTIPQEKLLFLKEETKQAFQLLEPMIINGKPRAAD
jgi:hypothetical protein